MRKSLYRQIGWPKRVEGQAAGPWKWIVGRAIEDKLTELAKYQSTAAGIENIYVANGVRLYVPELYLPIEIDIIVKDPETNRGWVVESKSYSDSYPAMKQIEKDRRPKDENLIQTCIYLLETQTGKRLKELIHKSLEERTVLDGVGRPHRNRCEANLEMLDQMDDGPVGCKLVYIGRGSLARTEMDIEIYESADGFHYPMVDGVPYQLFTIESIYERFRTAQNYWFRMRQEAVDRLEKKGIVPPPTINLILNRGDISAPFTETRSITVEDQAAEDKYYQLLEDEVRNLPDSFMPPPEYEWSYSPERVEELGKAGIIGKTKLADYKAKTKKGTPVLLGDWQCLLPGTPIELSSGTFYGIEDVPIGHLTTLGVVTNKVSKPIDREVVMVKPFNLLPLYLTHDHTVKVADGSFVEAGKLLEMRGVHRGNYGDEMVVPFNTTETEISLTDEELEIVGLWLAEGHWHMKNKAGTKHFKCGFTIHPDEEYQAEAIKIWASKYTNRWGSPATTTDRVKTDPRNGNHYRVLTVNSVEATGFLSQWVRGQDAHTKSLTSAVRTATQEQQLKLLSGMVMGDGCRTTMRTTHMNVYSTVSRQLALDVQRLLWRSGKVAGVTTQHNGGSYPNSGTIYHVRWYDTTSWASRIEDGVFYTKIYSVDRNVEYDGPVYDLTIDGSHEIPTASGVVHNCHYCQYAKTGCITRQKPELAYASYDFANIDDDVDVKIG